MPPRPVPASLVASHEQSPTSALSGTDCGKTAEADNVAGPLGLLRTTRRHPPPLIHVRAARRRTESGNAGVGRQGSGEVSRPWAQMRAEFAYRARLTGVRRSGCGHAGHSTT